LRRLARTCLAALFLSSGCLERPTSDRNIIVVSMSNSPSTLDPRIGSDDFSQKCAQLVFDNLFELDDHLRIAPGLAERLEHPDALTYVAVLRQGVRFHDGHELTAADVVYTFRSLLNPAFVSPRKGAFRALRSVEAHDRYSVVFRLSRPFESFPTSLVLGVVPDGASANLGAQPVGTGPYRFVRYRPDDRVELAAFPDYFGGAPRNAGVVLKIVPDDVMRGLELRKGTVDLVVNDLAPDTVHQLRDEDGLIVTEGPGVDYQYVGLNMRDPVLRDVRVRQALAHGIDRQAIVEHLRRGLATPASGFLPPLSWAAAPDVPSFRYDRARARALLDEAGYRDPDGDGPLPRLRLTLKVSNNEPYRLQAAVIQEQLKQIGVDVGIRSYEFATLYADVLAGNFQMYTLQWTGGSLADPDILNLVFHSSQVPPAGFNRGHFSDPVVDALLDRAAVEIDRRRRRELYGEAQRTIASQVPYVSLWFKTNFVVAQRALSGVRLTPLADFAFLKDVARGAYN
jgi:peptide/nickel transport system substrate-binding protein